MIKDKYHFINFVTQGIMEKWKSLLANLHVHDLNVGSDYTKLTGPMGLPETPWMNTFGDILKLHFTHRPVTKERVVWSIYVFIGAYGEDVEIDEPDTPKIKKEEKDTKQKQKQKSKVKSEPKSPVKSEPNPVKSEPKTPRRKPRQKTSQVESKPEDPEEPWTDTIRASSQKKLFAETLGSHSPESGPDESLDVFPESELLATILDAPAGRTRGRQPSKEGD